MQIDTALPLCPDTGKVILEISHSGLNTFNSCPKKWAFRKAILNFNEERRSSTAADVGSAMHAGIQEYMVSRDTDRALEVLAKEHPIELDDNGKANQYSLEASTITLLALIHSRQLDEYELATFIVDGEKKPAVEIGFLVVIELEHIVLHLRGFIDLVLLSHASERFMAVDIKTTTPQGAAFFREKYLYDYQCTSYGIPLQGLLGVEGDFDTAIFGIIQSDREPSFPFEPFRRTQQDVQDYYYWLLDACERIQRFWLAQQFPRGPNACVSYSKPCHFMSVCTLQTVPEMQNYMNPAHKLGAEPRPFVPTFTARLTHDWKPT